MYILMQIFTATLNMGIFFMTYILGDKSLLGVFAWAINIPLIGGLLLTPFLVKRFKGMYKLNLSGYILSTVAKRACNCGRLYGKRTTYAAVLRNCVTWHEPAPG